MSYDDLHVFEVDQFLAQPGAIVIDIRDIHSYKADHIDDALHIDGPTMGNLIRQRKANPPVLVYCYHGNSSRDIAKMISGFGFTNVCHLVGGWQAWTNYQRAAEQVDEVFGASLMEAYA